MLEARAGQPSLLTVRNLKKHFHVTGGLLGRTIGTVRAVDGVDFDVAPGECLGLVGESGSGKSTVGRCLVRAHRPTTGSMQYSLPGSGLMDASHAVGTQLRKLRRFAQMVFQDPYSSLNPRMTVLEIIGEPLKCYGIGSRSEREDRVRELMQCVGLLPDHIRRYPHAFSGGQRQRIGLARALALNPKLIIADEPVSALDVSVQAQVINLMIELQRQFGLTYIFIAHDLSVVRHISDRVAVMYVGKLVELAPVDQLFTQPRHPYTEALLSAVPHADPTRRHSAKRLEGEIADPSDPPAGCLFHPRCPYVEDRCRHDEPELSSVAPDHQARCHFAAELTLNREPLAAR